MPRAFDAGFSPGFGGPINVGTLLLKVGTNGPDPAYQDGDVVCAFNRRRTRHVHADHICKPKHAQRQANGLIAADHVSRLYLEATRQYRFERVSPTTVVRTNLLTQDVDVIGPVPNAQGEAMDVATYVARRRLAQDFGLFGAEGSEVWYGGRTLVGHAQMDAAWSAIEEHTPLREADFGLWPLGTLELRHFLAIHVDDFDDAEEGALTAIEEDTSDPENPVLIRKRQRQIPWRELRGMTAQRIAQVEDRSTPVDVRGERKHVRTVHVRVKPNG